MPVASMSSASSPSSPPADDEPWSALPPEVQLSVLSWLPPNAIPLSARPVCKAAAQRFTEPHHYTVHLSQPLPPHTIHAPLAQAEAALRNLTFRRKLQLLSVAAASGCETNLEVVWRLVSPGLFPELLQSGSYHSELECEALTRYNSGLDEADAGSPAAKSDSPRVLAWLLQHCPDMLCPHRALEAAARNCPLPQLQEFWQVLKAAECKIPVGLTSDVLSAAAKSTTPDTVQKLEWLFQEGCSYLTEDAAAAAASSGDLARLRWLRERGCSFNSSWVLDEALQHADLAVVEWLVDEAGCSPPSPDGGEAATRAIKAAAASGSVAKLRWLQARGFALTSQPPDSDDPIVAAARHGQLEAVQFLQQQYGGGELLTSQVLEAAVESGSVETAAYLRQSGCEVDAYTLWPSVGSSVGSLDMVRWLVEEARLGKAEHGVQSLISGWSGRGAQVSNRLLEAVRLMLPPGSRARGLQAGIVTGAAAAGELGLLRYLHEELGWRLTPGLLRAAAISGCQAVVEWLGERVGTDGGASGWDKVFQNTAVAGDLATMECMWHVGMRWSKGFPSVELLARSGGMPLQAVQWMWSKAPPPPETVMGVLREAAMRAEEEGHGSRAKGLLQLLQEQQGAGQEQQSLCIGSSRGT